MNWGTPPLNTTERLTLYGQCLSSRDTFLALFRDMIATGNAEPLLRLEDNYVACYEVGDAVWIVNSIYSLNAYFYTLHKGAFLHGDTLQRIWQQGSIDFRWNGEAVADLLAFGHLIGQDTLAQGVQPVAQGTVVHWDGERLQSKTFRHRELSDATPHQRLPEVLLDLFLDGLKAGVGRRPVVTASSGLDSRVNIAGLLHLGLRPELCVMGSPDAKDVQVVQAIGREFDLPVNHIALAAEDYVTHAARIASVTNGVKPLEHWHTFILGHKSGYHPEDHVITGNNGEHVRAVGFDYGLLAYAIDSLSRVDQQVLTRPLLARYWRMKTHVVLQPDELNRCAAEFASYYGAPRQIEKVEQVMPRDKTFVSRNDAFVLEQRRRGFQSCGLKLMSLAFSPFSSYLRKTWIDVGWNLPLSWRLGSRWHRYAVERLYPTLLQFPEEHERRRMLRRSRPLSWAPGIRKIYRSPHVVPYMNYRALMMRRDVVGLLYDHASELSDLIPVGVVRNVADEQLRTGSRGKLFATLTGMAIWRASLRDRHRTQHRPSHERVES